MVAASWLFAYAYSISFIAGEVKRPDKSIVWANVLAIAIPCVFMLWFAFGLYNSVGFQFNSAAAYNDNSGEIAATADLPWGTNIVGSGGDHGRRQCRAASSWPRSWRCRTWPSPCGW